MYRGADIPTVRSRISHILKPGLQPKCIVLQVAGNDATKQSSQAILARYETLLNDIRRRCPDATLVLSKVSPRQGTTRTMTTISEINRHLDSFAARMDNVCTIDVCPKSVHHFKRDRTHFNKWGLAYLADNLASTLRNFPLFHHPVPM